jgi:hypothetical protein
VHFKIAPRCVGKKLLQVFSLLFGMLHSLREGKYFLFRSTDDALGAKHVSLERRKF